YIGGQKARLLWRQIAMEIPEVYVNEKDSIANSILSQALSEVLEGKKDVDTALADAQKELESKME
ncbi:MAG: sugar ABC transporter substrate-binding protein, partial [Brevinematia bacterium]